MSLSLVILVAVAVAVAVAVGTYWVWPDRFVKNVIRSARQKKAQRSLDGLSVGELTRRAQAGDGAAQYRVGYMHATGDGIAVDYEKANYWFHRAVQAGMIDAFYCLGLHYERGRGTDVDYVKALELYEKAAQAGSADAQCNLGMMFLNGSGVNANAVRAASWFVPAKAQGHKPAAENLEWIVRNRDRLKAEELAEVRGIEALAERDDADALLVLGWMYAEGFTKARDVAAAEKLYKRSQARSHIFAHVLLTELTDERDGVRLKKVSAWASSA